MRHQLVALFTGGIEAERVINILVHRERHGRVGTIDTGTASVDQMIDIIVAAPLQNVRKPHDVAVNIRQWIFNGVTHPGLGGKVHHTLGLAAHETVPHGLTVGQIDTQMSVIGMIEVAGQTRLLESGVIVVVVVVQTNNAVAALKKTHDKR